jgi:hypothetical protein
MADAMKLQTKSFRQDDGKYQSSCTRSVSVRRAGKSRAEHGRALDSQRLFVGLNRPLDRVTGSTVDPADDVGLASGSRSAFRSR